MLLLGIGGRCGLVVILWEGGGGWFHRCGWIKYKINPSSQQKWYGSYLHVEVWGIYINIVTHTACVSDMIKGFLDRGMKNRWFDIFVDRVQFIH